MKNKQTKLLEDAKNKYKNSNEEEMLKINIEGYGINTENIGIIKDKEIGKFFRNINQEIDSKKLEKNDVKVVVYDNPKEIIYGIQDEEEIVLYGKYEKKEKIMEDVNLMIVDDFKVYVLLSEKYKEDSSVEVVSLKHDLKYIENQIEKNSEKITLIVSKNGENEFKKSFPGKDYKFIRNEKFLEMNKVNNLDLKEKITKYKMEVLGYDKYGKYKTFQRDGFEKRIWKEIKGITSDIPSKIKKAIKEEKVIRIIHDFDCDGISSGAKMKVELLKFGVKEENIKVICKSREELYRGITPSIEEKVGENEVVIAVDLGSNDIESFKRFNGKGCEVIVIDHHEDTGENKKFYSSKENILINPAFRDETDLKNSLSALGLVCLVGMKLNVKNKEGLREVLGNEIQIMNYGIKVDMVDNNKSNIYINVINIETDKSEGKGFLYNLYGEKVRSDEIGFKASLINKLSKVGEPEKAFNILEAAMKGEEVYKKSNELEPYLEKYKKDKLELMSENDNFKITDEISFREIDEKYKVYSSEIRSKLTSCKGVKFAAIYTVVDKDKIKISAGIGDRYEGVEIQKLKHHLADTVLSVGGHSKAFGMTLEKSKLSELKEKIVEYIKENIKAENKNETKLELWQLEEKEVKKMYEELGADGVYLTDKAVVGVCGGISGTVEKNELRTAAKIGDLNIISFSNPEETAYALEKGEMPIGAEGKIRRNIYKGKESYQMIIDGVSGVRTKSSLTGKRKEAISIMEKNDIEYMKEKSFNYKTNIVGTTYVKKEIIEEYIREKPLIILKRDYENEFSKNAIMVGYEKEEQFIQLGYIKEVDETGYRLASTVSSLIDSGVNVEVGSNVEFTGNDLFVKNYTKSEIIKQKSIEIREMMKAGNVNKVSELQDEMKELSEDVMEVSYILGKFYEKEYEKEVKELGIWNIPDKVYKTLSNEERSIIDESKNKRDLTSVIKGDKYQKYEKSNYVNYKLTKNHIVTSIIPKYEKIKKEYSEKTEKIILYFDKKIKEGKIDEITKYEEKYKKENFSKNMIGINIEIYGSNDKKKVEIIDERVKLDYEKTEIVLRDEFVPNDESKYIILAEGPVNDTINKFIINEPNIGVFIGDKKARAIVCSKDALIHSDIKAIKGRTVIVKGFTTLLDSGLSKYINKLELFGQEVKVVVVNDKNERNRFCSERNSLQSIRNEAARKIADVENTEKFNEDIEKSENPILKEIGEKYDELKTEIVKIMELTKDLKSMYEKKKISTSDEKVKIDEEIKYLRKERVDRIGIKIVGSTEKAKDINNRIEKLEYMIEYSKKLEKERDENDIKDVVLNLKEYSDVNESKKITEAEKEFFGIEKQNTFQELIISVLETEKTGDIKEEIENKCKEVKEYKLLKKDREKLGKAIAEKDEKILAEFIEKDCQKGYGIDFKTLKNMNEYGVSLGGMIKEVCDNKNLFINDKLTKEIMYMHEEGELNIVLSDKDIIKLHKSFAALDDKASFQEMKDKLKYYKNVSGEFGIIEKAVYGMIEKASKEKINNTEAAEIEFRRNYVAGFVSSDVIKNIDAKIGEKYKAKVVEQQLIIDFKEKKEVVDIFKAIIQMPHCKNLLEERAAEGKGVTIEIEDTKLNGQIFYNENKNSFRVNFGTSAKKNKAGVFYKNEIVVTYLKTERGLVLSSCTEERIKEVSNPDDIRKVELNKSGTIHEYIDEGSGEILGQKTFLNKNSLEEINEKLIEFVEDYRNEIREECNVDEKRESAEIS